MSEIETVTILNPYDTYYLGIEKRLNNLCMQQKTLRKAYSNYIIFFNTPDWNWEDEQYLDELSLERAHITEQIDRLKQDYHSWRCKFKNFNDSIQEGYLKFKSHPKRVLRILTEQNLEFGEKSFDEILFENDEPPYYTKKSLHFAEPELKQEPDEDYDDEEEDEEDGYEDDD
jgi:hypothetical protein